MLPLLITRIHELTLIINVIEAAIFVYAVLEIATELFDLLDQLDREEVGL
jgi:hypothetical protein